jgi:hypothetical protein
MAGRPDNPYASTFALMGKRTLSRRYTLVFETTSRTLRTVCLIRAAQITNGLDPKPKTLTKQGGAGRFMHTRFHALDGHTATHNESPSNTSFNMLLVEKKKEKALPPHQTATLRRWRASVGRSDLRLRWFLDRFRHRWAERGFL